jgi:hypothetical protein
VSDKKPDVRKLKKKRRVGDLLDGLRYAEASIRAEAAEALGEIGDWNAAAELWSLARSLVDNAARLGEWDPVSAARPLLKSWAKGSAKNPDQALRAEASRILAELETQEELRLAVLLGSEDPYHANLALPALAVPETPVHGGVPDTGPAPAPTQRSTTDRSADLSPAKAAPEAEHTESPPERPGQAGPQAEPGPVGQAPLQASATPAGPRPVPISAVLHGH